MAWKPWEPDTANPWNLKWAAHLFRRAAFGAPAYAESSTDLGRRAAGGPPGPGADAQPALRRLDPGQAEFDRMLDDVVSRIGKPRRFEFEPDSALSEIQSWWLYRLLYTPHPLREKMTLFWHNHFATSYAKVKRGSLMLQTESAPPRTGARQVPGLAISPSARTRRC